MNRKIKFRVWDKKNSKFLVNIHNGIDEVGFDLWDWAEQMSSCLSFPMDSYVFQQYTELKDSKDKEIFEGDILSYPSKDFFNKKPFKLIGQVKYEKDYGSFIFAYPISLTRSEYYVLNRNIACRATIIGNIFDNPELLTKS